MRLFGKNVNEVILITRFNDMTTHTYLMLERLLRLV